MLRKQSDYHASHRKDQDWRTDVHIQEVLRWEENMKVQYHATELELKLTVGFKQFYGLVREQHQRHAENKNAEYFLGLDKQPQVDVAAIRSGGYDLKAREASAGFDEVKNPSLARDIEIAVAPGYDLNRFGTVRNITAHNMVRLLIVMLGFFGSA